MTAARTPHGRQQEGPQRTSAREPPAGQRARCLGLSAPSPREALWRPARPGKPGISPCGPGPGLTGLLGAAPAPLRAEGSAREQSRPRTGHRDGGRAGEGGQVLEEGKPGDLCKRLDSEPGAADPVGVSGGRSPSGAKARAWESPRERGVGRGWEGPGCGGGDRPEARGQTPAPRTSPGEREKEAGGCPGGAGKEAVPASVFLRSRGRLEPGERGS